MSTGPISPNKVAIERSLSEFWNVKDEFKGESLAFLKAVCILDQLPFSVCAVNLTGNLNVGVIIRNASIFGAERAFVIGRRKYDKRTTVGAENYIEVIRVDGMNDDESVDSDAVYNTIIQHGYTPIFIETGGESIFHADFGELMKSRPCFVFGSEESGLPEDLIKRGRVLSIPQRGVLRSLNVSTAAGIVLYEVNKSMLSQFRYV